VKRKDQRREEMQGGMRRTYRDAEIGGQHVVGCDEVPPAGKKRTKAREEGIRNSQMACMRDLNIITHLIIF